LARKPRSALCRSRGSEGRLIALVAEIPAQLIGRMAVELLAGVPVGAEMMEIIVALEEPVLCLLVLSAEHAEERKLTTRRRGSEKKHFGAQRHSFSLPHWPCGDSLPRSLLHRQPILGILCAEGLSSLTSKPSAA
jgi:hypothetical protein